MGSLSLKQVISDSNRINPVNPVRFYTTRRRLHFQTRRFLFPLIRCKQSEFQDFQDYAKPSRLLPATELKVCTETSLKRIFLSVDAGGSRSLFKVKIQTSNFYGSGLSDVNAGILLCLIDENGDSILQRIPASLMTDYPDQTEDRTDPGVVRFQRGSSDEFMFEGPRLGKVEAVWISVESGQWRLGGVSLTVIDSCQTSSEENCGAQIQYIGISYDFKFDDILLGERDNASMVELRPSLVTESSGVDPFNLFSKSLSQPTSLLSGAISNEESMKEYADLKFSLLLYDAILVVLGTSITNFSVSESSAVAFLIGGFSGFLYLLILQRSIDELPAPASTFRSSAGSFKRFKTPVTITALAVGFSVVTAKYCSSGGNIPFALTPKDLLIGTMGFLACKVAVVLAAFKPVTANQKENK
ncbi:hypothetical protein Dsin_019053 [Dipteronia sinensis]|uniref:DUF7755 domain-containing protein n=1 Tax=Dipteronia sinensis TaxID=43782 RepID=A0AAE0A6F9_9ROSI|nr:hypothetical protein Dsin_019053 [Dipteronia sinensis]